MSVVIDIVLVLIIIFSIYRGYKKGIVNIGFKILAFVLSLIISIVLYGPITDLIINNTDIDEKIEQVIIDNGIVEENSNVSNGIETFIQNYSEDLAKNTQNTIVKTTAKPIAKNVVGIAVMIILFLGSRIILTILKMFTNIITDIPIIKQCNEVAGMIYGLLISAIIIYGLLAITFFAMSLSGNTTINTVIENSYITKFLYNNNIILEILFN